MREQQLAEVLIDRFPLFVAELHARVAQGQALHLGAGFIRAHERHERAARRLDRVPGLLRQTVAVAGRAGQRIGRAAGAQQHRAACDRAVRGQNAVYRAVRDRKARHRRLPPLDAAALQRALQHVQNIGGAVRDGKHAVAALDLERAAALLKKGHCRFRREGRHGAVEEAPVARNIFQRLFGGAGICDIAAALAGDEELFAAAAVFFEQEDPTPARGGLNCGKQPCRSPAHDHGVKCGLFHRHGTDPRPAPGGRASARSRACGGTSARRSGR